MTLQEEERQGTGTTNTGAWDPYANKKVAPASNGNAQEATATIVDPPPASNVHSANFGAIEDLLGLDTNTNSATPSQQHVEDTFEEILGLDGLSEEDKQALLAEQRRILAAIELTKSDAAMAAAEAFEARSFTSALNASTQQNREITDAEQAQMAADEELAQQLQKEEYKRAERSEQRERQQQQAREEKTAEPGWMEWLGLSSPQSSSPDRPMSFAQPTPERGEIGISLPPGAQRPNRRVETETITFSNSYDEHESLVNRSSPNRPAVARVAERQPIFNCVADSIASAASTAMTALHTQTLFTDTEGNVHGVDGSSLLDQGGENGAGYDRLQDKE